MRLHGSSYNNKLTGIGHECCTVVGITILDTEEQALALSTPLGGVLYTIVFGDGSDAFVPEEL